MWRSVVFCSLVSLAFGLNAEIKYNKGEDAASILEYEASDEGLWTEWLDMDFPKGTGEYENMERFNLITKNKACQLIPCLKPRAMEITLSSKITKHSKTAEISGALRCSKYSVSFEHDTLGFKCHNADMRTKKLGDGCEQICKDNFMNRIGKGGCYWCPNVAIRFYCLATDKLKCDPKREMTEEAQAKQIMLANVMEILDNLQDEK